MNFGNFKLGEICGVKFNDLNGNGKKDDGEPGLAGWTITLTPGGATMVTDADGHYCFSGLFTGDYTLTETLQDGWKADPGAGWGEHHQQRAGDRQCELRQLQAGRNLRREV